MEKKMRRSMWICLALIFVLGIASFISYSSFNVINPFVTTSGLAQIFLTDKDYVQIQEYPKVILAKPNFSLQVYMEGLGFQEDIENQMGALYRFNNDVSSQYIRYSRNRHFSKWIWQE